MKRALIAAFLFCVSASVGTAQDIGGRYAVAGTNVDGTPYGGEAMITLTSETTCEIEWMTGATSSTGICMRNQNAFSAGYVLGDAVGLVIYEVMADGTLNGIWTIAGQPGTGTEILTPQ